MSASGPKTISRAATRRIAELRAGLTACRVYTLDNGFRGADVDPAHAWEALAKGLHAKLRDNGNGVYTVHVHSNRWYELTAR